MGKQYDHLWPQVASFENLLLAYHKAAKGKRSKPSVASFEFDLEGNLLQLRDELRSGAYQPGVYDSLRIHEPKRRLISAAPFRDQVLHHALCQVIEPAFEASFIHQGHTNRPVPCRSHGWGGATSFVATSSCCQHSGTGFRD